MTTVQYKVAESIKTLERDYDTAQYFDKENNLWLVLYQKKNELHRIVRIDVAGNMKIINN